MITKSDLKFLLKNGFFHIFSSNVVNKILQFGISIVIVRIISKELFGAWSYANNILSFFLLVNGLGVSSGLLQFSSAARDKKEPFRRSGFPDRSYSKFCLGMPETSKTVRTDKGNRIL